MTSNTKVDAARVELLLTDLRLPGIKLMWAKLAEQSDKEGWPAARFLAALAEYETADRGRRRIERHLAEARLPAGKTLATFDFEAVPMVSKAQVMALAAGDAWLGKGANILLFGPPGGGKSHLSAALGLALVENGWRVLFASTTPTTPLPRAICWRPVLAKMSPNLFSPPRRPSMACRAWR
jgi:DNA replication protein DnaC